MQAPERIQESIYHTIRERILSGEYPPGNKIGEISLAKEFGCSRTPIRESFKRLEHDRLLEIRPKSGTYVRRETREDYIHRMEVRAYLESLAFRTLYSRATRRELTILRRMVREMDRKEVSTRGDMTRFGELHIAFHVKFVELTDNPLLIRLYQQLNFRMSIMLYFEMDSAVRRRVQQEHRRIMDYLEARDPAGEAYIRDVIFQSMQRHLAVWDENALGDS